MSSSLTLLSLLLFIVKRGCKLRKMANDSRFAVMLAGKTVTSQPEVAKALPETVGSEAPYQGTESCCEL